MFHLGRYSASDPYERCGAIVREHGLVHFIELPNRHPEPEHRFSITAGDVRAALRARRSDETAVLGFFHTHRGERALRRPSSRDLHYARKMPKYVHAVYHPETDTIVWYDHTGVVGEETFTRYISWRQRNG